MAEPEDAAVLRAGMDDLHAKAEDLRGRVADADRQIASYEKLRGTLRALAEHRRVDLMAPVCGGLAYFEGAVVHPTELLVLLGDKLFAERSTEQALGIVARRLAMLEETRADLATQRRNADDKLRFAVDHGPDLVPEAAQASPEPVVRPTPAATNKASAAAPAPPAPPAAQTTAAAPAASVSLPAGFSDPFGTDELQGAGQESGSDIDDDDRLTLEEIEALEEQLGEDVWDEALVEARMRAMVHAKRAHRLGARTAPVAAPRHQDPAPAQTPESTTAAPAPLPSRIDTTATSSSASTAMARSAVRERQAGLRPMGTGQPRPMAAKPAGKPSLFRQELGQ